MLLPLHGMLFPQQTLLLFPSYLLLIEPQLALHQKVFSDT